MNIKASVVISTLLLSSPASLFADDSDNEYYKRAFMGNVGSCSEDRRTNEFGLKTPFGPGPRTGCYGNTFGATVTINGVEVKSTGNKKYEITVTYGGGYDRRNFISGCIHNHTEHKGVSGRYTFALTEKRNSRPVIQDGTFSMVGEVPGMGHDSNKFAACSVKKAINKATFE